MGRTIERVDTPPKTVHNIAPETVEAKKLIDDAPYHDWYKLPSYSSAEEAQRIRNRLRNGVFREQIRRKELRLVNQGEIIYFLKTKRELT